MGHDLLVNFTKWPTDASGAWLDELARMGIEAAFHPEFDPVHDANWCPVALLFELETKLPVAKKLRRFGRFESGFEFYPSDSGAMFSSKSEEGSLAAFVCGSALAAATHGELIDPQSGDKASGSTGLEILEVFFPEGTLLDGPVRPRRFTGWNEDEERAESDDESE